jgi:CBS domain-containing protein
MSLEHYEQLKAWRQTEMGSVSLDHFQLNEFHDKLMKETVRIALKKVASEWGKPPAHFAFFVMGSAGRMEQSVWSDQDHGIVYHSATDDQDYFLKVGTEISKGLEEVGYAQCEGNVMASKALWCKSRDEWERQIIAWLEENDWESLRYFSTFFDSRVLVGDNELLFRLKELAFTKLEEEPFLYRRLYENVGFIKKGIGIFGQLLPEEKGQDAGTINLKQTIFFPYVNSLRLLALLEKITVASTLERFQRLPDHLSDMKAYQADFLKLLNYRLYYQKNAVSYQKVHLLQVNSLSSRERESLKAMMKKGRKLFKETKELIDQRCSL